MASHEHPGPDPSPDQDGAELAIIGGETADHTVPADALSRALAGLLQVEPLDLSPMTFDHIEWGSRRLVIDPPLSLHPTMDEESGQLYVLSEEGLGIHVFAQTREQLADDLAEQLIFQWDAYARESPDRLTPPARRLREALRTRMRAEDLSSQPEGW